MVEFFRVRARLWAVAGIWTGVLLTAFNAYAAVVTYVPQFRIRNDFRLVYGTALNAWQHGYPHLYDLAQQKAAVEGLGAYWSPYLNPPPLAWLGTLFLPLPFGMATVLWTILIAVAAVLAWWLVAPGAGLTRWAHLGLFIGLFPTAFGIMVGQPVALVAAAVGLGWWLARRERPILAGVALSLTLFKPQIALLVPVCLLVAGRYRIVGGWFVATGFMGLASIALLGAEGVIRYRDALALASGWEITRGYAASGVLGTGLVLRVEQVGVVAAVVLAAWRWRRDGIEIPIAAGITGSLLITPYLGFQDFAMLVVAGWLVIRSGATQLQVGLMVAGYALLELALVVLAVPILVAEAAFLATFLWSRRWDSNPRPATYEAAALPAELRRQTLGRKI